jgi:hypothetical protein
MERGLGGWEGAACGWVALSPQQVGGPAAGPSPPTSPRQRPTLSTIMQPPNAHTQAQKKWHSSSLPGPAPALPCPCSPNPTPPPHLVHHLAAAKRPHAGKHKVVLQQLLVGRRRAADALLGQDALQDLADGHDLGVVGGEKVRGTVGGGFRWGQARGALRCRDAALRLPAACNSPEECPSPAPPGPHPLPQAPPPPTWLTAGSGTTVLKLRRQ